MYENKKMKSLAILLILAIGISLIFSVVPSAYAVAGDEFNNPTQTNAYASYNSDTNDVQVQWDFDTLPTDTVCLLKGDFWFYTDLNLTHDVTGAENADPTHADYGTYTQVTAFIPQYYSVVSSSPTTATNSDIAEEVPCQGTTRINIDIIMSHPSNIDVNGNPHLDLQIFLTFYVANSDGSLDVSGASRIDEVFVMYTPNDTWRTEAKAYACGGQIGSTLYIDKSGTNGATAIHGNNGDNCVGADFVYYELQSKEWVDIGMVNNYPGLTQGETATGFHNTPFFSLLIEVGVDLTPVTLKSGGGGCSGDCIIPTFYKNKSGVKVVKDGFSFSGNATDVSGYHTPYDLITVNTNQVYNLKLKVYENNYLEWIQIGFGMPEIGSPLNDAESLTTVYLNVDKSIDRVVTVEKHTLVDISRNSVSMVECGYTEQECYLLDIDFVYRDQQKNNIIAIEAVDRSRNNVIHYINDGILIVGESMNTPLEQQTTASNGGAFYPQRDGAVLLTLVDYKNDLWQDEYGYMWSTTQYGPYIMDAVPVPIKDADPLSNVMTRTNSNFGGIIQYEEDRAIMVFDASKLVSVLGETFAYEYNLQSHEDYQKEMAIKLEIEADRATKLTKDYSLNQSLYQKNAYNHWDYFGDMTLDEVKEFDAQNRLQLKDELDAQRLELQDNYHDRWTHYEQILQDKLDKQKQVEEHARQLNENY